ncbi:Regulatory protein NPR3 [Spatholobus suberectus]|nr:Regulatory protein NPR3 [Spatholobus suberectus]
MDVQNVVGNCDTSAVLFIVRTLELALAVAFASLFFPSEAKLAVDIAHAETTSKFAGLSASKGSNGNLRKVHLDNLGFFFSLSVMLIVAVSVTLNVSDPVRR